ncbi:MAG: phosphoglycerate mutase [Ramlibacter sp.]|uniref:phosphoglycerate mutase n=1 Tax=Ramlibacter sp. TaxID=1917967 RepID=UPI002614524B|nr:phosphoglycerate mutase [Ramlibacter sp.]MDH4376025.1 phosphoglycerate mutase [Ramlibacter sp.]
MTDTALHLIVSHAGATDDARRQTLAGLRLPHLTRLLSRLERLPDEVAPAEREPERTLSLPHERAQARALGLPGEDGYLPWAAWRQASAGRLPGGANIDGGRFDSAAPDGPAPDGQAFARLTPCHWAVGSDHIALRDPEALQLSDEESQTLLAAMQPYFTEDGLAVQWERALCWTARGDLLQGLPCASLDRVIGRRVDDWLPRTAAARPIRRLQQEMQMLLYTHPVNEAREQRGLLPVNSFWVDGAGALPVGWAASGPASGLAEVRLDERLRGPTMEGDAAAWGLAWQQLDDEALPPLLQALEAGRAVYLTLAGERAAAAFGPRSGGGQSLPRAISRAISRASALWRSPRPAHVLDTL